MFDPYEGEVSTLDVVPESLHVDPDWKYVMATSDWVPPEGACCFAYDLEAVPNAPKPEVVVHDPRTYESDKVLKTETTVKQFLGEGCCKDDSTVLLQLEQDGKCRKGVISTLKAHVEGGDEDLQAWKKLATDSRNARIVAMSICFYNDPVPVVWTAETKAQERELISAFYRTHATGRTRTGYNIAIYDDRLISYRAMTLGVDVPCPLHCAKFGGKQSVDIALNLFGDVAHMMKLKTLLPIQGIQPPAGDTNGGDVLGMVEGGQWDRLAMYVASDAWSEMELYKKAQRYIELG
jgi:hypothetical protein